MPKFTFKKGNILEADTQAIVNTVNTYGVMGKGIALAFKKYFPDNYKAYRKEYEDGNLQIGKMHVFITGKLTPEYIINFPTKKNWRNKSQLSYIIDGMNDLIAVVQQEGIQSIAIPPLGCSNGGLDWAKVKEILVTKLSTIEDSLDVVIYEPGFSLNEKPVKPIQKLNPTRAIYLHLMRQYESFDEEITTLVVQKIAYLLQEGGENLNLRFEKGYYGPYATNLNKMLEAFKPNYISYQGELNKPTTVISLKEESKEEREKIIANDLSQAQRSRLKYLESLIEGFENAFGLELLATVAFVLKNCPDCTKEDVVSVIHKWTKRKESLLSPHLIGVSYDRIQEFNLIENPPH